MENEKQILRQLSFKDAEVQALAEARERALGSLSAAVRAVFTDLKQSVTDLGAELAQEKEDHAYTRAALDELHRKLADAESRVRELEAVPQFDAFADLSSLKPEAAEYLRTVRNEMLEAGLHPTTAHWLLSMLDSMQKADGYIPSSNQKIKPEWMQ